MRSWLRILSKKNKNRIFLLLALVTTLSSAFISYFVVRQTDFKISDLRIEVQKKQDLIKDIWNDIGKKESKADIAILISILAQQNNDEANKIKKLYLNEFNLTESAKAIEIANEAKKESEKTGEYIDNLYLEQISIQNKLIELEKQNKTYSDISFFLQILSLIIIIIRNDFPI